MATRYTRKPNPEIKKNVLQARSNVRGTGTARAVVAGASVLATLAGFAAFSSVDAQALAASQAASTATAQAAVSTSAQTSAQPSLTLDLSGVGGFFSNIANAVGSSGAAISSAASSATSSQPSAFTFTRSSR